jgi:hypothetical protein
VKTKDLVALAALIAAVNNEWSFAALIIVIAWLYSMQPKD